MPTKKNEPVEIVEMTTRQISFCAVGSTPMLMHRLSQKARMELLYPGRKKNCAELESSLKHDPISEFRSACYKNRDKNTPTLFHLPDGTVRGAIANAALDMPGAKKAKIERLVSIVDATVFLYGIPQVVTMPVRPSGFNAAPDIRTRPIFPEYACFFTLEYPDKFLTQRDITSLAAASGRICGWGDWRPQKGGSFGKFNIVSPDDPLFQRIVKEQGRAAQEQAYEHPVFYDEDTEELLGWFAEEVERRDQTLEGFAEAAE